MGAESLEASPLRERCVDFTRLSFDRLPFADALEELTAAPKDCQTPKPPTSKTKALLKFHIWDGGWVKNFVRI